MHVGDVCAWWWESHFSDIAHPGGVVGVGAVPTHFLYIAATRSLLHLHFLYNLHLSVLQVLAIVNRQIDLKGRQMGPIPSYTPGFQNCCNGQEWQVYKAPFDLTL